MLKVNFAHSSSTYLSGLTNDSILFNASKVLVEGLLAHAQGIDNFLLGKV